MARPRKPREATSVSVHFRLDAKRYDAVVDQAGRDGLRLADWLRRLVERATKPPPPPFRP